MATGGSPPPACRSPAEPPRFARADHRARGTRSCRGRPLPTPPPRAPTRKGRRPCRPGRPGARCRLVPATLAWAEYCQADPDWPVGQSDRLPRVDLTLTDSEAAFRDEVRSWLDENHPGPAPEGDDTAEFEFRRAWQKKMHEAGWAGISWPEEYGGRGATLIEQAIFNEELARQKAPGVANVLGLVMGGPVVIAHGTDEQKQRFLKPILTAEEIWCQGFSEPESGSDLASLKTKAVKSNGEWVVTGQKVWTTFAHEAKWCMLVARTDTDAPKHKGLTYFLMDMEQDAVQVRPLRQITGEAEFNEIFMEEARIPDENIVGGVGNGWTVAITTLMNERAGLGLGSAIALKTGLSELVELLRERGLDEDPLIRQRVAELYIN